MAAVGTEAVNYNQLKIYKDWADAQYASASDETALEARVQALEEKPDYQLPVASATQLGGVKQGTNITIAEDGTISASGGGGEPYVLPVATASTLGGVKQGSNVTIAGDGTISVAAPYVLPEASTTAIGGLKIASDTDFKAYMGIA